MMWPLGGVPSRPAGDTDSVRDTGDRDEHGEPRVEIVYPGPMDDLDWAMTETKGWIEVTVRRDGRDTAVTFYDPHRLGQEMTDAIARQGYFTEGVLVVVPTVTKAAVEAVALSLR